MKSIGVTFYNHAVLFREISIISVSLWVLLTYSSSLIFLDTESRDEIIILLPITALIGSLLYLIELLSINYRIIKLKIENNNESSAVYDKENETESEVVYDSSEIENNFLERVALKSGQKIHVILVPDIVYIQSDGDYVQ